MPFATKTRLTKGDGPLRVASRSKNKSRPSRKRGRREKAGKDSKLKSGTLWQCGHGPYVRIHVPSAETICMNQA